MRRLHIVCEGQTEERFVQEVLAVHLHGHGISATAPILGRSGHKGGAVTWARLYNDLRRLLRDQGVLVTTLIDYYGLDSEFPGLHEAKTRNGTDAKAEAVETAMTNALAQAIGPAAQRFLPYVQMHEFEGLLFSDPSAFAAGIGRSALAPRFQAIADRFVTPEDINDGQASAPSKRILALVPSYDKPLLGTLAALEIGLSRMRAACPRFHAWLGRLEALGSSQ